MPESKETLNRRKNRLLDFGDRLLRGLTGGKSLTGGLIEQSAFCHFHDFEMISMRGLQTMFLYRLCSAIIAHDDWQLGLDTWA